MKKLMAVIILVGMLFVTIGADFNHEINKDVALEQSSLFDQLTKRWKSGKVGWAVGYDEHNKGFITNTEDGGENWVSQVDEGGLPMSLSGVSAVNRNTAWGVGGAHDGYGTILRTRNRGKKWVRQGSVGEIPNVGFAAVSAVSPSIAWVVGDSGVILKTKNGGRTWEQQAIGILTQKDQFQDVYALDKNHVWASSGSTGKAHILHTSNGGKTWAKQGEDDIPPDVYGLLGIHAVNQDIVWTAGVRGVVMISTDGGQSWLSNRILHTELHNNHVVAINDQIAWVTADYHNMYYTFDGGFNWDEQTLPSGGSTDYIMGITAVNENEAWAVSVAANNEGVIYHTKDGGAHWLLQTNPVSANLWRISFAGALR